MFWFIQKQCSENSAFLILRILQLFTCEVTCVFFLKSRLLFNIFYFEKLSYMKSLPNKNYNIILSIVERSTENIEKYLIFLQVIIWTMVI